MTGIRGTEATSAASGISVRPQQSFAVNGRIRFGNDSFTLLDLQGNTSSNISLLRLNYALGTLATAKDKLGELLGLTDELLELAEDAALDSTSHSKRKSIDRRFQDKVEDFQELLDDSSKDGVDFLNKKELTGLLEFAGLDEELAGRLSSTFKRLAGVDSILGYEDVQGATVRYKKKVRDQNPLRNHQVTQEAANGGQGIPFLKTTDSVTRNLQFETAAQYAENSAGDSLLGSATNTDAISLGSDLADYNQRFIAADGTGLLALVATGDSDKAVLQFYSMADPNAITHYSTITTLDTAYDSVIADVAPNLGSYAYLNEDRTTLHYNNGADKSLSVTGGTISQLDVVNGKIFFTSNATSLGANGSEDDLFYFDPGVKTPTPTRIAALTYSDESFAAIEAFTTTADGSRVAFTINEGGESSALTTGATKDLVLLEVASGKYSRLEDTALYNLSAPTGSTSNYQNVAFDSSGDTIYIAQEDVGNPNNKSIAQYDITDIETPIFFAPQATGVFDAPLTVDTAQQFFLGDTKVQDLNGDGKLDIIGTFTDQDANTGIATYLGNGNGTFQNVSTQTFTSSPASLFALGDITEDGYSDILSTTAGGDLQLYGGSSSGTFTEVQTFSTSAISEIALADADNDGTLDLFTASSGVSTSSVYYREGLTGTFNSPTTVTVTDQTIEDLRLQDVNGDGNVDIITSGASRSVSNTPTLAVKTGRGDGTFSLTRTSDLFDGFDIIPFLGSNPTAIAVTLGDINDDGTADAISIIRGSSDSTLNIALGSGDGTFQSLTFYDVEVGVSANAQIELRDVNNDSIQDILVNGSAGGSGVLHVLEGRGDGTFAPAVTSTSALTTSNFFGVGDFDNDNILDVLQAGSDSATGTASDPEFTIRLGGISQTPATGTFSSASSTTSDSSIALTTHSFLPESSGQAFTYTSLGTPRLTDLDGDGNLDAVMTFSDSGAGASGLVSFLGNSDGTFQTPVTSGDDGGFTVDGMTLGDFNGDSNIDAFVSSGTGLYFWSGQGDGTFSVNITSATGTSSLNTVVDLQSGDIDGDGNLDVTVSGTTKSGISIENFFGDGSGGFGSQASQSVGSGTTVKDGLAVADVTGDSAPEIILGTSNAGTSTITTLINSGTGTFSSSTSNSFSATSITGLDVGSVGLSANQDLVASATTSTGQLTMLFAGDGAGTFSTSFSEANSGEVSGNIQLQDLNNDGSLDIVQGGRLQGGTTNGVIRTFINHSSGSFSTSRSYESGSASAGLAIAASTFDGNSSGDVFYAGADGSTGYYSRVGALLTAQMSGVTSITADFDQDGEIDILSGLSTSTYTTIATQLGNGDSTFDVAITSTLTESGNITHLATGDFNGDGTPDIAFTSSGSTSTSNDDVIGYAIGVGDGTFSGVTTAIGTPDIYALQVGDVTGDGIDDLITSGNRAGAGEIQVFSGDGSGAFNLASPATTYGTGKSVSAFSLFDIEGDGDTDIIATEVDNLSNGYVRTYLNDGSGTFTASATTSTGTVVTFANTNMVRGDLNNDGEIDVVVTSTGSTSPKGNASVLFGDGDGTFTLSQTYQQESQSTTRVQLTDLNRDGQLDLLTSGTNASSAGEASIRLGVGDGTFRQRMTLDPGATSPIGLFTEDLNNDGDDEFIAIQSPSSGNLRTTVREPSYGSAGTIIRTGNTTLGNISASTTSTIFGFSAEGSGVEEFYTTAASDSYGKDSNLVGGSNKALTFQLSAEASNNGGANIFNPQLGGLYGTELFYSTTANYGSTNPDGLEGFTKQTLSLAGVESTKIESSTDNAIKDISPDGRYALIEDKNDNTQVRSLRVYDLETDSVLFDVGEFIHNSSINETHSATFFKKLNLGPLGDELAVAYTRPGDTSNIYTVSSSAPNTILSRTVDGAIDGNLISHDVGYVYSAKNGSPETGKLYVTDGYHPNDNVKTIDLGDGRSATMSATSISTNGFFLTTTDETNQLYLVSSLKGSPMVHETSIGNVLETSMSANGERVAILQLSDSTYTVSLYRTSNNELIHMESTQFDDSTAEITSLSMNGNGTQISVVRKDNEGNEEVFRAIDTTKKVTKIVKKTSSVSVGTNETINPLKHALTDVGYSMLATETVKELRKEIEADLKDVTKVLDELSTSIRGAFKSGPSELRALSKGYSTEALQKFAQNVAEQIRATSYETLLLANELDQATAVQLLRSGR